MTSLIASCLHDKIHTHTHISITSKVLQCFGKCLFVAQIRGAFNKFPDFFVQALKIGVDS